MTGNSVLVGLVGTRFDMRREPLASHMRNLLEGEPVWRAALTEHEQTLRCLQLRDPLAYPRGGGALGHALSASGRAPACQKLPLFVRPIFPVLLLA